MNDELADFLGPDNNESGTESDAESDRGASGSSQAPTKSEGLLLRNGGSSLKRSRHAEDSDDGEDEVNGGEEDETLRKKKRVYKDDDGADEDVDPFSGATLVAGEDGDDVSDEEGDLEAELEAAFALEAEGGGEEQEEEEEPGKRGF